MELHEPSQSISDLCSPDTRTRGTSMIDTEVSPAIAYVVLLTIAIDNIPLRWTCTACEDDLIEIESFEMWSDSISRNLKDLPIMTFVLPACTHTVRISFLLIIRDDSFLTCVDFGQDDSYLWD